MFETGAPLAALARYRQFVLWRVEERPEGQTKVPVNPITLRRAKTIAPSTWTDAKTAQQRAKETGLGIGFVFTESDPFYFVDIDHCNEGGAWSPFALDILSRLPGAAVEVSQSGEGLHVIGTGHPGPHGCKNADVGLELYTDLRFVALTGRDIVGDAATDGTAALSAIVEQYLPPGVTAGSDWLDAWTTEPAEEWAGPEDDEELIKRAMRSKSAQNVFGRRASFKELWTADADALGAVFPDPKGYRDYDASQADSALSQHLAFWTGGDCERIHRLMWLSSLVRDKWVGREDYLPRTILGTVLRQATYYQERRKRTPAPAPAPDPGEVADGPAVISGYQYLSADAQLEHLAGCVYVQSLHRAFTPSGALLKPEQFNATFGGYVFQIDETGDKTTRKAWEAFTESQVVRFPKVENICFRPELEPGSIIRDDGATLVNTYVPIDTPRKQGDPGRFLTHLEKVLPVPRDREILLSYIAACVQHKGVKFQWAPLLQGTEGNGKTLFTRCVAHALGHKYTHLPKASDIDNKFNAWISGKLFIGIEDVFVPEHKREVIEAIKPLITNDRIEIQAKGSDQITGDNRANFLLNANLRDAIRKTRNDRRFCVFYTAQQGAADLERDGMTGDYFPELYAWLRGGGYAIVADYLDRYPIPDEFNPATSCHRAPATSSTDAALFESLGGVEHEVMEAIDEGRVGFRGGWVSSLALDRLLDVLRMGRAIPRNKRRAMLQDLGFDWHPALNGGRATRPILEDGGKPRIFIRNGHEALGITSPGAVTDAYEAAQKGLDAGDVFG